MPSDPLEAELLMMAEAVASHKKDSDSESDPEADFGTGFDGEGAAFFFLAFNFSAEINLIV